MCNLVVFGPSAGILDQAHKARKGRFNIGSFARAKRLAKEEAIASAVSKCTELQSIKESCAERCAEVENEIHALKLKVGYSRLCFIIFSPESNEGRLLKTRES